MSDSSKAVFLSYASQDAEAAKRICDALRAAGLEVWFDQNELAGGDAWDAKIRKQIKDCALFVPVISANTQARREGYFRIEWKLAAQRTQAIAEGTPFLLPVVIDATRDDVALVPEEFRAVQWTQLSDGGKSDAFCRRLVVLLDGGAAGAAPASPGGSRSFAEPFPATAARLSETQSLVAKAWAQMNKAGLSRAELEIADGLCQRATALDPNEADAWAAWSQVDSWYLYHNLDDSPARREGARTKATRALQLAPGSYEARLAQACYLVRDTGHWSVSLYAGEADGLLQALQKEKPAEPRSLLVQGILLRNAGNLAGAKTSLSLLAANPNFAALAWNEIGWAEHLLHGDYRAAEAAAERSVALEPCWPNLALKVLLALNWRGDLDVAKATQERMPAAVLQEDHGVAQSCIVHYYRREPANMLRLLGGVSRDWLRSSSYNGPKAWWAALAHAMAGRKESARLMWQTALRQVELRLADQPDSAALLKWQGRLLIRLEQFPEAEKIVQLANEVGGSESNPTTRVLDAVGQYRLGHAEAALDAIEEEAGQQVNMLMLAAACRLNPTLDPLRGHPRFQALQVRLDADPRKSPTAPPRP